jgi:hypothetical protein
MAKVTGEMNIQELYHDLTRKYRNVGNKVDAIWRRFTPKQREEAMRQSSGDGKVLKHSGDRTLGNFYMFVPEYNLRDMSSEPEHFLSILRFRASTPLSHQLYEGVNEGPGDREIVEKTGMYYRDAPPEERMVFLEGENYGKMIMPRPVSSGSDPRDTTDFFLIRSALGRPILFRQQHLFQFLNHIVEDILDLGSETRNNTAP